MRVTLMIEGQEGVSWEQWLALADACEMHGVAALFRSDHYRSLAAPDERAATDAWTLLGALAARTTRLRLGTLVSPVTFRHAAVVAKAAATVDHISEGRVEVGVGAGWMEIEHERSGFDFPPLDERLRRLRTDVEAVDRLLRDDPLCVQEPRPPLIVGGGARRGTADPAARYADEYNTHGVDPEEARRRRTRLDEACERVGRDPASLRFSVMTAFCFDLEHARRLVDRYPSWGAPSDVFEELRARRVAGTPDELRAGLREFEAAGVDGVMLQHVVHEDVDAVATIGRELVENLA